MITTSCGNPSCPNRGFSKDTRSRWVQVEETQLIGELRGQGPAQRLFAAVACSKRCAAMILTAASDADDAAAEPDPFAGAFEQP